MRSVLLALVCLPLVLATTGCGRRDPVQLELREYQRVVVGPLTADEELFSEELAKVEEADPKGELTPAALLPLFRDRLLPIYQRVLERTQAHRPRSAQVAALHAEVLAYYEAGRRDLERCVAAMTAGDRKALEEVQQAMVSRDADGLAGRMERLYTRHHLSIE